MYLDLFVLMYSMYQLCWCIYHNYAFCKYLNDILWICRYYRNVKILKISDLNLYRSLQKVKISKNWKIIIILGLRESICLKIQYVMQVIESFYEHHGPIFSLINWWSKKLFSLTFSIFIMILSKHNYDSIIFTFLIKPIMTQNFFKIFLMVRHS